MRRSAGALVIASLLALGGCGDDDGDAASTGTPVTTTSSAPTTTTGSSAPVPETTTQAPPASCPDDAPVPAGATDIQAAPVPFDGDGDGSDDVLSVFRFDGATWLQVAWAAGGSGAVTLADADLGARPLGGHDLDGDGTDEAWVAIAGPASGSIVGVFRVAGCGLGAVVASGTGEPFVFPVTSSVGSFSGATCDSTGDLSLVEGVLADDTVPTYDATVTPYRYDAAAGSVAPGTAETTTVDAAGAATLASLACGALGGVR